MFLVVLGTSEASINPSPSFWPPFSGSLFLFGTIIMTLLSVFKSLNASALKSIWDQIKN